MNKKIALLAAAVAAMPAISAFAVVNGIVETSGANNDNYVNTVIQNQGTGFGNNQSELDGAYFKYTPGGSFDIALTGNLETNNTLVMFIDSKVGGAVNAAVPGGFNNFAHGETPGVNDYGIRTIGWNNATVAPGFNPEFALEINRTSTGYHFDIVDLTEPPGNPTANVNRKRYFGHTTMPTLAGVQATTEYLRDGETSSGKFIVHQLNDTNTAGVGSADGGTGVGTHTGGETATTGWEFSIDSAFLGASPGTALRAMTFIAGGDSYLSNQFLPGIGAPTGNLAYNKFNAQTFGDESYLQAFIPTNSTTGTSTWATPANWTGGTTPNGAERSALINGATQQFVDIGAGPVSLGYLKFDNPQGVTMDGTGTLSMDGGAGAAIIVANAGTNDINPIVDIPDDTRVRVSTGAGLSFVNGFNIPANQRITKAGAGTLTVGNSFTMPLGASLAIDAGTVDLMAIPNGAAGDIYVGGVGSVASITFHSGGTYNALAINGQGTATVNAALTLKNLYVNGGAANGSASITISDGGAGGAQIKSDGGKGDGHVNVPVILAQSTLADIGGGSQAFLDSTFTIPAAATLTKTSSGWLTITGTQAHGAGTHFGIDGGQINFGANVGAGLAGPDRPDVFVNLGTGSDGKARFDADQQLETLRINNDGVATIAASGGNTLVEMQNLVFEATGKVNIKDNKMLVHTGTLGSFVGLAYDGITGEIQAGRNGGTWDGTHGIISDLPNAAGIGALTSVGVALADDVARVGDTFGGAVLASGDVMVMYTHSGDANLDGMVDSEDYFYIDQGFNDSLLGYSNGDFDYNGVIDVDDYFLIDRAYGRGDTPFPQGPSGVSAVPEPTGLSVVALAAVAALARRRRAGRAM